MRRAEGEPPKKPIYKRVWETITRRGRREPSLFIQQFEQMLNEQERLEREATTRERERQRQATADQLQRQQEQQRREAADQRRREQKIQRELTLGYETDQALAQEVTEAQFDQVAEFIKKRLWKNKGHVFIDNVSTPAVTEKDDGTVINRSIYGMKLSYLHKDVISNSESSIYGEKEMVEEELSFGIGYFGDRSQIVPEAQGSVTNEELERGVKAYFIRAQRYNRFGVSNPNVLRRGGASITTFPFAYPDYRQAFRNYLFQSTKSLAPEQVIPAAKRRVGIMKDRVRRGEEWGRNHPGGNHAHN